MNPGQVIIVQLVDESGHHFDLENVFVDIELFTNGNYRYGFRMKRPTVENGQLRISYDDIESERAANARIFLMDYNTPLLNCDDRIKVCIPSMEALQTAYDSIGKWFKGIVPEYAEKWRTSNNWKIKTTEVWIVLTGGETLVEVPCSPV